MAGERKHTAGEWRAMPAGVVSDGGIVICEAPADHLRSRQFWDDNALLLAASKELLEALKEARREIKALHRELPVKPARYELDVLEKINAAIAAATATEPASPEDA